MKLPHSLSLTDEQVRELIHHQLPAHSDWLVNARFDVHSSQLLEIVPMSDLKSLYPNISERLAMASSMIGAFPVRHGDTQQFNARLIVLPNPLYTPRNMQSHPLLHYLFCLPMQGEPTIHTVVNTWRLKHAFLRCPAQSRAGRHYRVGVGAATINTLTQSIEQLWYHDDVDVAARREPYPIGNILREEGHLLTVTCTMHSQGCDFGFAIE